MRTAQVELFSDWMGEHGFNQTQAGAYLGYTQGQVSRWLSGSALLPEVVFKLVQLELVVMRELKPDFADIHDEDGYSMLRSYAARLQGSLEWQREMACGAA